MQTHPVSTARASRLHAAHVTLTPKAPFDLQRSIDFLGHFPPTAGEQALGPSVLTKALRIGGRMVVVEARATGTVEAPQLQLKLITDGALPDAVRDLAIDRFGFFLSLDDDLVPFHALAAQDPPFAPVAERLRGLHQVKFPTPFEIAAWSILTQRTRIPMARRMKQALTDRFGGSLEVAGQRHDAFPEAAEIAAAGEDEIRSVVGAGARAPRIVALAHAFRDVDDAFLRRAPYPQVETWLRGLPGIGPWSAAFILLRGLGRMEALPVEEARLGDAAAAVYGRPLDARALGRLAAHYGAYQGYWAYYLRVHG